jgi:hypothetical protein
MEDILTLLTVNAACTALLLTGGSCCRSGALRGPSVASSVSTFACTGQDR